MYCALLNVIRFCRVQLVQISDKTHGFFYGFHPLLNNKNNKDT